MIQCDTFTNGTSRSLTFTGSRNSDGELVSVHVTGTASNNNCFRNLNYISGKLRWPADGAYATYAYSDDICIRFVGDQNSPPGRDGVYVPNDGSDWMVYDLRHNQVNSSTWVRINMTPDGCSGKTFDATAYPMVCLEQDKGCMFEPYKGTTLNITLPSDIYAGTVDLIAGTVTATHKRISLSGQGGSWGWNSFSIVVDDTNLADDNNSVNVIACSHSNNLVTGITVWGDKTSNNLVAVSAGKQVRYRDNSNFTDLESARNYLQAQATAGTPVQVVAKLINPIVYTIDPITLRTLRGINNIWSNQGAVEVQYWTH